MRPQKAPKKALNPRKHVEPKIWDVILGSRGFDMVPGSCRRAPKGIADALNARGIRTARGRRWYPSTVKNLLDRALGARRVKEAA